MKKMSVKKNANKLFNGNVHKVRSAKQRKALFGIKADMKKSYRIMKREAML